MLRCNRENHRQRGVQNSSKCRQTASKWLSIAQRRFDLQRELGYVPLSTTAELLFEVFSQRYERRSVIVTSNPPLDEWTGVFGSERLTGALLDRLTHHVHILEMNGDSYRLKQSMRRQRQPQAAEPSDN